MFNFFSSEHVGRLLLKTYDPDCDLKRVEFDSVKTPGGRKEDMGFVYFDSKTTVGLALFTFRLA
jgi:hypothetical protein